MQKFDPDIASIPDQDLEEIWNAIHDGASTPAEALGFDEATLASIERMALGYYRATRYGAAASIYGFILRMAPKRVSAWRGLGACCAVIKEYAFAEQCFRSAVDLAPGDVVSRVFLGEVLCHQGKKDEGLDILRQVVQGGAKTAEESLYVTRARAIVGADGGVPTRVVLKRMGQNLVQNAGALDTINLEEPPLEFDESRDIQWEDIKRNPQLMKSIQELKDLVADGRLTLAEVGGFTDNELDGAYAVACKYVEMNQVVQAMQIIGYLIFIDPYKARYHQLVGICLQRLQQYEAADQYYGVAESIDPDDPMTRIYRGESKLMCGKVDDGLKYVRAGLELAQVNAGQHKDLINRGNILLKQFSA